MMKGKEGPLRREGVEHCEDAAVDDTFPRAFAGSQRFASRPKLGGFWNPSHMLVVALFGLTCLGLTLGNNEQHRPRPRIGWGVATAAYQVEGGAADGGRTPSIWDTRSHIPGNTHNNDTGDVADDFYHLYRADIELMKKYKVQYFRFSISWNRIYPTRDGPVNQAGVAFYNNLIDALLAAGIKPVVTLYHWDLPQWSQDAYGGWNDRQVVADFAKFAGTCFRAFGDRVKIWATFNEPWTFCTLGYGWGVFAPGISGNPWICGHNVLLAHAKAVAKFRKLEPKLQGRISIVINIDWTEPFSKNQSDIDAAALKLEVFGMWFSDPVFKGDYSPLMKQTLGSRLPAFTAAEKAMLKGSADMFMLNNYLSTYVKALPEPAGPDTIAFWQDSAYNSEGVRIGPVADSPWLNIVPWGFRKLITYITRRYNRPEIWITENGVDVPNENSMPLDVVVHDQFRIDFFSSYISNMLDAIDIDGANVRAYLAWSFLDNFEWNDGYSFRFGVVYVDFATQKRYPKDSFKWLSDFFMGSQNKTGCKG